MSCAYADGIVVCKQYCHLHVVRAQVFLNWYRSGPYLEFFEQGAVLTDTVSLISGGGGG